MRTAPVTIIRQSYRGEGTAILAGCLSAGLEPLERREVRVRCNAVAKGGHQAGAGLYIIGKSAPSGLLAQSPRRRCNRNGRLRRYREVSHEWLRVLLDCVVTGEITIGEFMYSVEESRMKQMAPVDRSKFTGSCKAQVTSWSAEAQ